MAAPQPGLTHSATDDLAVRGSATLDTVRDALSALTSRYRTDEVLTSVKHIPAREAQFGRCPLGAS